MGATLNTTAEHSCILGEENTNPFDFQPNCRQGECPCADPLLRITLHYDKPLHRNAPWKRAAWAEETRNNLYGRKLGSQWDKNKLWNLFQFFSLSLSRIWCFFLFKARQFDSIYCWVMLFVQLRIRMRSRYLSHATYFHKKLSFHTDLSIRSATLLRLVRSAMLHTLEWLRIRWPCVCVWVGEKVTEKWIEHSLVFHPFRSETYFNDSYHIYWTSHAFRNPNNCTANDYLWQYVRNLIIVLLQRTPSWPHTRHRSFLVAESSFAQPQTVVMVGSEWRSQRASVRESNGPNSILSARLMVKIYYGIC